MRDLRMTKQRQVILRTVRQAQDHPTADEVYERVRRELPRISLGTVYRNLDLLAEHGLVRRLESGAKMRFDGRVRSHVHLRCVRCERVDDAPVEVPLALERTDPELGGYRVLGCQVQFTGLCPRCRAEQKTNQ